MAWIGSAGAAPYLRVVYEDFTYPCRQIHLLPKVRPLGGIRHDDVRAALKARLLELHQGFLTQQGELKRSQELRLSSRISTLLALGWGYG
jgi:hypothetical protein